MSYHQTIARVPVIYFAGGMKGNWQDRITEACKGAIFIDPRKSGQPAESDYTAWDLAAVERCDAIIGLMEQGNPGGSGLAVEFGWGASIGRHLMLVEEVGFPQERYFGMVRAIANQTVKASSHEDAVKLAIELVQKYIVTRQADAASDLYGDRHTFEARACYPTLKHEKIEP